MQACAQAWMLALKQGILIRKLVRESTNQSSYLVYHPGVSCIYLYDHNSSIPLMHTLTEAISSTSIPPDYVHVTDFSNVTHSRFTEVWKR